MSEPKKDQFKIKVMQLIAELKRDQPISDDM